MAKVSFSEIFKSGAANQQEESNNFAGALQAGATNISFTSQDPSVTNFSGNNVPGVLTYTLNGQTFSIDGIVSRLFKSGNTYEGFYFVASGSDFALGSQEQTTAYILVWPGRSSAFPDQDAATAGTSGTYGTSSDPVDSALNSLLAAQPTLLGITEADADDKINVNQTVVYTFTFSNDIDASTFTAADIVNAGTAGISIGSITETSPGVFQVVVTGTSTGTIQLAIPQGSQVLSATGYGLDTSQRIVDDSVIQVSAPALQVSSPTVNEGSPYGVFTVTGTAGQQISLALATGTATAADFGSTAFDVSLDGGQTWQPYTAAVTLTGTTALVRTTITNDAISDNNETFTLTATATGGTPAVGTATIKDDGTGTIFNADGTPNNTAVKNDDRPVEVSNLSVNEGSPYGVFTVKSNPGQVLDLSLSGGTATVSLDYRKAYEFSSDNGKTWTTYASGQTIVSTTTLVRFALINDSLIDNGETLVLTAQARGGNPATGTATILDNGTGTIFNPDGSENATAVKNDDSIKPVYSVLLSGGDRYYTKDATDAAKMALGTGNVFEGVRFDNLSASQGGAHRDAYYQAITKDWYFTTSASATPYACYTVQPAKAGFEVANSSFSGGTDFRMYLNAKGITQIMSSAEATALGLSSQGYVDKGVVFSSTTRTAFTFDAEGYLVVNRENSAIQTFVKSLSTTFTSTASKDFIEAVEQHYLTYGILNGLDHGSNATAADLNAAFATNFIA